ncbi:Protein phosphatase 2C 16 [Vitis vinifera]|uniref:Protein phosphatase 2C 16 n=1 Tax=Vitis vinifera TaxID=29760 RepID=A0A438CZ99_VITVI|nr:Protein phosphatase 2C 16 [Vitis vinifera]
MDLSFLLNLGVLFVMYLVAAKLAHYNLQFVSFSCCYGSSLTLFCLQLDRQDELARIEEAGGQILYWQGPRVEGVLSMTRAIGDHYLKPWIISEPEVAFTTRSDEDECLILASDGLWDVLSNEQVVKVARNSLREERRKALLNDSSLPPAHSAADSLLCCALAEYSDDNISIIVVDLKSRKRRHQYRH